MIIDISKCYKSDYTKDRRISQNFGFLCVYFYVFIPFSISSEAIHSAYFQYFILFYYDQLLFFIIIMHF
ncbi:hypothetical protein HMPREF3033_00156 [Veillonellaceae bacterium DNF00751]|nr:hypothetical protein HMPREF3033_00156 [Veillonellaceae bacterium DNF00751]